MWYLELVQMVQFMKFCVGLSTCLWLLTAPAVAERPLDISFNKSKTYLKSRVYYDNKRTLYCNAPFDFQNQMDLPSDFYVNKYVKRSNRMEWEHIVPAENFGRAFSEWRNGDPDCVTQSGKTYKGRRCARKVNSQFRIMEADMYNLYPSVGSVNALRSNYNFAELPDNEGTFIKACNFRIYNRKVEPDEFAKGIIARTYLYFDNEYPIYHMSKQTKRLMEIWNAQYPVTPWECTRAKRIEDIQGNPNKFVKEPCVEKGWYDDTKSQKNIKHQN